MHGVRIVSETQTFGEHNAEMPGSVTVIDAHVHLWGEEYIESFKGSLDRNGICRANIVCTFDRKLVNHNAAAWEAKARYPETFYVFPGLDHAGVFSDGALTPPALVDQVNQMAAAGADGVKLIESKPGYRREIGLPLDGAYFEPFFAAMEDSGMPLLWHVADPEEFWDPKRTPRWAAERGWGYDDSYPSCESLYSEMLAVLERHPCLRVIFPHFLFLSADLPRAEALLEQYSGAHLDLGPGIELFYNLSRNPDIAREFFIRWADRIMYASDAFSGLTDAEYDSRAGFVRRFLETTDEFRLPPEADFLLGPPEDGIIRGISLPPDALSRICAGNFVRLVGDRPRRANRDLAAAECRRLASEQAHLIGVPESEAPAAAAAQRLLTAGL